MHKQLAGNFMQECRHFARLLSRVLNLRGPLRACALATNGQRAWICSCSRSMILRGGSTIRNSLQNQVSNLGALALIFFFRLHVSQKEDVGAKLHSSKCAKAGTDEDRSSHGLRETSQFLYPLTAPARPVLPNTSTCWLRFHFRPAIRVGCDT